MISWIRRAERKVCITRERFSKLQFDVSGKSSISALLWQLMVKSGSSIV